MYRTVQGACPGACPYHPKTCVFGLSNILSDHLVADVEMLEARIEHAVFVKLYLAAIRGLDEAAALPRGGLAESSERRRVMRLYIVAQAAHVVLQLPPHRFESVANRPHTHPCADPLSISKVR